MTPIQIVAVIALALVAIQYVTSLMGKKIPILSIATLGMLLAFVAFEIWKLYGAVLARFAIQ
ncbi:MAG: hypothetical protein AAF974_00220 [Cyanobacteria bacterium P01_E01_bin.34]